MRLILSLLAAAAAPGAMAGQSVSASQPGVVQFNPPLDTPMVIAISDDRLLPDGSHMRFDIAHRLIFSGQPVGMVASLEQISIHCTGASARCDAFVATLRPGNGRVRRYQRTADGSFRLAGGRGSGDELVANPSVAGAIDTARGVGNDVAAAELTEALAFVGMTLAPVADDAGMSATLSADHIHVVQIEALPGRASDPPMVMRRTSDIDRASGLLTAAETVVHGSTASSPVISRRLWQLSPEIRPVS